MWMNKLAAGVLRVQTTIGPRYIGPSFRDRLFLMWIFRHFDTLPQQVLNGWQQRFVERLCVDHRFIAMPHRNLAEAPVIGTVERRPIGGVEAVPAKRPPVSVTESASAAVVARVRPRS